MRSHDKYGRSQSVPCEEYEVKDKSSKSPSLLHRSQSVSEYERLLQTVKVPTSIDATSPDNCVVTSTMTVNSRKRLQLDMVDSATQKYSPSNYNQKSQKPDREKKMGSPHRRKSSKSLFKRLMGSFEDSPVDNKAVSIGIGQTVRLSESKPTDSVSQLSLDIPTGGDNTKQLGSQCAYCTSNSSLGSDRQLDSKEMAAIEAGRKVFDVTCADHCKLVDVDPANPSTLDKTALYQVSFISVRFIAFSACMELSPFIINMGLWRGNFIHFKALYM